MSDQAVDHAPGFTAHPGYEVGFETCAKRVRAVWSGTVVADTKRVRLLSETAHVPVYYFPRDDLRMDLLQPSAATPPSVPSRVRPPTGT